MFINAGYDPIVMPASVSEELPLPMVPETATMFLALKKGEAVRRRIQDKSAITIVAADTVVVCDGEIIGKPKKELTHIVYSAISGEITRCDYRMLHN